MKRLQRILRFARYICMRINTRRNSYWQSVQNFTYQVLECEINIFQSCNCNVRFVGNFFQLHYRNNVYSVQLKQLVFWNLNCITAIIVIALSWEKIQSPVSARGADAQKLWHLHMTLLWLTVTQINIILTWHFQAALTQALWHLIAPGAISLAYGAVTLPYEGHAILATEMYDSVKSGAGSLQPAVGY